MRSGGGDHSPPAQVGCFSSSLPSKAARFSDNRSCLCPGLSTSRGTCPFLRVLPTPHPHATIRLSVPPPDSRDKKPPRRSEVLHVAEAAARGTCPRGSGPLRSHIASSALCGAHTSFLPLAGAEAREGLEEQQTWGPRAPRCPPRPHGWPGHVVLTQSHPGPSSGLKGEASPTHAEGGVGRHSGGRWPCDP